MEKISQLLTSTLPAWLVTGLAILVPILFIIAVYPAIFAFVTWVERKMLGRIQNRYGPNRVGPVGLFQPIADGLKVLTKEDIVPRSADKFVHFLAPVLIVAPALLVYSVVPIAPGLVPVNLSMGILFALAVGTVSVIALFMAGWASRNKFSLLGAMRAVAQVVSYEMPTVMAALSVVMAAGTLSTVEIAEKQGGGVLNVSNWFVFQPWGFAGFVLFVIGALAEAARCPFDLPEAESEIVAGYHTEYSGFKFALFQMGEYLAAIAMAGIAVTMFLGGYNGPGSGPGLIGGLIGAGWFFGKLGMMIVFYIWIRGTWPRVRVDQLMGFAWKFLLPMAVVNIIAVGIWHFAPSKPVGWVVTAAWLLVWFVLLAKINAGKALEKREYRYV
jgi:NADH-quinone oxidoreductase subunit H